MAPVEFIASSENKDDFDIKMGDNIIGTMFKNKNIKGNLISFTVRSLDNRTAIVPDEREAIRWLVNKVGIEQRND